MRLSRNHLNQESPDLQDFLQADGETRTPDPFITSEVLYQLSYVGKRADSRTSRPTVIGRPSPPPA